MITTFEEHTADLSEVEMKYLEDVKSSIIDCFTEKHWAETSNGRVLVGSKLVEEPIKQKELAESINFALIKKYGLFVELVINHVRLRKYFNYFRTNGVIPIIATSNGCYISHKKEEVQKQITSLEERARQIQRAAEGLKKFLL